MNQSNEITITIPKPHENQSKVLREAKRFNVLCNGRRWGKSKLAERIAIKSSIAGENVGIWCPTYKDVHDMWKELKHALSDIIKDKNEQLKQIELITGGLIDAWSMEDPDSGRGRKYHKAIVDEFAKAKKGKDAWEGTIRPTLTDYMGSAWIFSTPKGMDGYFYQLFNNKKEYDDWMSWQMPTITNPFIEPSEIEQAKKLLDPTIFMQEYEAKFISHADNPFMYNFKDSHIGRTEPNFKDTFYLSFDFNVDPLTCIVGQHGPDWINILDEIRLSNSNLYDICQVIKSNYGDCHLLITGDASGGNRNVAAKGGLNNYKIILQELGLPESHLLIPSKNPAINESRTLCNSILWSFPNLIIDSECRHLIDDLRYTSVDQFGNIDKKNPNRTHLLDCFRYYLNTFFGEYLEMKRQ